MTKEDYKAEYLNILTSNVSREGIDKLVTWLEKSDFFDAPASAKFHCSFEGGLALHSINVYKRFLFNIQHEYGTEWQNKVSLETITLCALLHDVCKANFYKQDYKNVKVNGVWEQQSYYSVDDQLPYGHGEKSVYIVNGFVKLTREEAMAINWHMGAFDDRVKGGSYALSTVFYKYPLAFLFHISDMEATYLDEN